MKPYEDYAGVWDSDMDMRYGLGKLWHEIRVNASYSHKGSYDRWMPLNEILNTPYWRDKRESIEGEDEVREMLSELESRGKILLHMFEGESVKIAPEIAKKEMETRKNMANVVANWEKNGSSFTFGT